MLRQLKIALLVIQAALLATGCMETTGVSGTEKLDSEARGDNPQETRQDTDLAEVPDSDEDTGVLILDGEIKVVRDAYGVPHVIADTDEDAMYGLGYAVASDRLFQMNYMLYGLQGRLAEVLGRTAMGTGDSVQHDRKMRVAGYWRNAKRVADNLKGEEKALLQAYSDGVNRYVADNSGDLNPLFAQTGMTPEHWTPAHSLGAWYWIGLLFGNDGLDEGADLHAFEDLVAQVGLDAALDEKLCSGHPGDPSVAIVQLADVPLETVQGISQYAETIGADVTHHCGNGDPTPRSLSHYGHSTPKFSHAWVVGGSRTTTGKAALVSDPQTPVSFPSLWHEFAIHSSTIKARGISAPGMPGFLIGWTEHMAWGATAAGFDQKDLFRIQLDTTTPNAYIFDGVSTAMFVEEETILVKGEDSQQVTYRETMLGPLVTEFAVDASGEQFALHSTQFFEQDRSTFTGFLKMMRADSVDEFNTAVDDFRFPGLNYIAGDDKGDILFRLGGAVPVRSTLSPLGGSIAQNGNSSDYLWQGTIPGQYMPQVKNPSQGYILSGNHRAVAEWYPLPLGTGTGGGGHTQRSYRLSELLAALPSKATPDEVLNNVQWDCVDAALRDIATMGAHLNQLGLLSAAASNASQALDGWLAGGGSTTVNDDGAYLASKLDKKFRANVTGVEVAQQYGGGENGITFFAKTMMESLGNDPSFVPTANVIAYINSWLENAWNAVGHVPQDNWTTAYQSQANTTLGFSETLGLPGVSTDTSDSAQLSCISGSTIWSQRAQSYTHWIDLANVDSSLAILPIGSSERIDNDHSQDQIPLWEDGELRPAPLSASSILDAAASTLVLERP